MSEEKELRYKGFTIYYKQTSHPAPNWLTTVYFIDGVNRSPLGTEWATTEESAIEMGKSIVDQEIGFWRDVAGKIPAQCPYPSSVLEE